MTHADRDVRGPAAGSRIVLFAGYPKTGTTSLQQSLFRTAPGINYVSYAGLKHYGLADDRQLASERFYRAVLALDGERAREEYRATIAPHLRAGGCNVIGDELFTNWLRTTPDRVPSIVAPVLPGATVLLVLRRQSDLLRSLYDFQPTLRVDESHARYVKLTEWWRHHMDNNSRWLEYDRVLDSYAECFGRDRVVPVLFEGLFSGDEAETGRLADLLGVPVPTVRQALEGPVVNAAADQGWKRLRTAVAGARFVPVPVYRALQPLRRAVNRLYRPTRTELPDAARHEAAERFRASNQRLADHWGVDVGRYRYDGLAAA